MILLHPVVELQSSEALTAFFILATFSPKLCGDDDDDDAGGARFQLVIYVSCRFVPLFNSKKKLR